MELILYLPFAVGWMLGLILREYNMSTAFALMGVVTWLYIVKQDNK